MADRNLEKIIQQLKDALPMIQKKVDKFTEIANRLDETFVGAAIGKDLYDKLMDRVAEKNEQEEALQQLSEAILRIDQIFKGKKWTKELTVLRKSYELTRLKMEENIKRIDSAVGKMASGEMPEPLTRLSKDMNNILDTYIGGSRVTKDISDTLNFHGKLIVFMKIIKYRVKVDGAGKILYIVLSQEFDSVLKKPRYLKISVFPDRLEKPPFERATWYVNNIKPTKNEAIFPKGATTGISRDRIIGLIDYYGLSAMLSKKIKYKEFNATKNGIMKLKEKDWFFVANDDPKKGPALGKSPIALLGIRAEHLEGYVDDKLSGSVHPTKLMGILKDVAAMYPKGRSVKMDYESPVKVDDPTGEDPYIYKLKIKFYKPGILQFAINR